MKFDNSDITLVLKYFWLGDAQSQKMKKVSQKMSKSYNNKFGVWTYLKFGSKLPLVLLNHLSLHCQSAFWKLQKVRNHTNNYAGSVKRHINGFQYLHFFDKCESIIWLTPDKWSIFYLLGLVLFARNDTNFCHQLLLVRLVQQRSSK